MSYRRQVVRVAPVLLAAAACDGSCTNPRTAVGPSDCDIQAVNFTGPTSVQVNEQAAISYSVIQSNCTLAEMTGTWSSESPGIATVAVTGMPSDFTARVTGVSPGPVKIFVQFAVASHFHPLTVTAPPGGTIVVSPPNASLGVGQTQQMSASCFDGGGAPITPCALAWGIQPGGVATISPGGLVTGVAAGTATVTATAGSLAGQATVTVTAAPAPVRLAYGLVTASGTPDPAYGFNSLGGALTAVRQSAGRYQVTIPGFGGTAGESRLPFVNAISAAATVCMAIDWTMIGVTDATVNVECTTPAGVFLDSDFVVLAVGQGGLPGDLAFGYSGPVAGMPPVGTVATLPATSAWSSAGPVRFHRDDIIPNGRYRMLFGLPNAPPVAFAVVMSPAGHADSRCALAGWSGMMDVVCHPRGSTTYGNAPFTGMLLESGRPGLRIASAAASAPTTPSYQAPVFGRRNSAGGTITIQRSGAGTYQVVFQGMGRPDAARREIVMVSTATLISPASCRLSAPWSTAVGADLAIHVRCVDGDGTASDQSFFVVVIE